MQVPSELRGRWAVITGASSGLGVLFAERLAQGGMHVVLVARRKERMLELAAKIEREHRVQTLVLAEDLSDLSSPARVFERTEGEGREVAVLINNAGYGTHTAFVDMPIEKVEEQLRLNVVSLTTLARRFGDSMRNRRRGYILNVSSIQAFGPIPGYATYCASKAYVKSFSEAFAFEMKGTGVVVTCSAPGGTATEFLEVAGYEPRGMVKLMQGSAARVVDQSLAAMFRGTLTVVPGFENALMVRLLMLLPHKLGIWISGRIAQAPRPKLGR